MAEIVCAGHICLDLIPTMPRPAAIDPGKLFEVGPCSVSTGGSVANTGAALKKLGVDVALCAKVGVDPFGSMIESILATGGLHLAWPPDPKENTSYTIVFSPPNTDRAFFHFPGANDSFNPDDIGVDVLGRARILHLGYPPLMRGLYSRPDRIAALFARARKQGTITSLDMSMPDPNSDAAKVDWTSWLADVLPHVDVFTPSAEELGVMLSMPVIQEGERRALAGVAIRLGARMVMLKLGGDGLLLADSAGREVIQPCLPARVVGTTGAGDAATAGLLCSLLHEKSLEEAARIAAAVGAASVEASDATSGIPTWELLEMRLASEWAKR